MSVAPLYCLRIGSLLVLVTSTSVQSTGPMQLFASAGPPQPILGLEDHQAALQEIPAVPALMDSSQEGSGFFSEDSEENKAPQALRQWEGQGDINSSLDTDSLIGYNPSSPGPSSVSLRSEHKDVNLSLPFFAAPTSDAMDADRWEGDSEASGFPSHPSLSLSTAAAGPLLEATTTITKLFGWGSPLPEAAAGSDVPSPPRRAFDEERKNLLTLAPTVPEVGLVPSRAPLQPDEAQRESSEEQSEEEEELVAFPTEIDGEEEDQWMRGTALTIEPSSTPASDIPIVAFSETVWQDVGATKGEEEHGEEEEEAELRHGGTEYLSETDLHDSQEEVQVICVDWSDLAGKGYVILNMSDNYDCDEFRVENGDRLLEMLESTFSRRMNSPQGSWLISLSKPTRQDHQLLMTLANEQGVIATKDVLSMLGEIRRGLDEIGIQNFSSVSTCHSRPSQPRSDYGKLFIVLVVIGSVCLTIIASGLVYICWQRRLPKTKNMSRGEELHFVENGCHDNPTLDVTNDGQSEMQEKKQSANGVPVGSGGGSGWQVLVNKPGKEEEDNQEEDTHL
ncbi:podocalyxin-like protein 2 [Electrophorus electricus]|uniref:podocalyxin-like protein 2 n=1 Tax=Electrophorus electricus TaxID=8005 RepID=UPI0015D07FC7|nr:podocalyxin-like protein 2 [Electrophorus electricus]